jgi:hypothetical protein
VRNPKRKQTPRSTAADGCLKVSYSPTLHRDIVSPAIGGFAEHNNVLFLVTCNGDFMVQLESMHFKKLPGTRFMSNYHPFESVYTAGNNTPLHSGYI